MVQAKSSIVRCGESSENHEQNRRETTPLYYYPKAPSSHSFESTTNDINAAFLRTLSGSSSSSNSFVDSTTNQISLHPYNPPDFKNRHSIKCDSLDDQNLLASDLSCSSSGKRLDLSNERTSLLPVYYSSSLSIQKQEKENQLDSNGDSSPINVATIMAPNSASLFGSLSEYSSDTESESSIDQVIEEERVSVKGVGVIKEIRWINHYSSNQRILLVGDGDFSFSNSLAEAFGSATNITATSLDSEGYLYNNYEKAMSNIQSLKQRGCIVLHGVDATEMANHVWLKGITFDRIVFNFPLAGFFPKEPRDAKISKNRALVGGFLENAKKMISENGEIHITHKSNGFFQQWKLQAIALARGLRLIQELHFNFKDYPGYRTKYGFGGDDNFNCNPSRTYKFDWPSIYK